MNQKEIETEISAFLPEDAFNKKEIIDFLTEDREKTFEKAFPEERQRIVIIALARRILDMHQYHADEEEEPRENP